MGIVPGRTTCLCYLVVEAGDSRPANLHEHGVIGRAINTYFSSVR